MLPPLPFHWPRGAPHFVNSGIATDHDPCYPLMKGQSGDVLFLSSSPDLHGNTSANN